MIEKSKVIFLFVVFCLVVAAACLFTGLRIGYSHARRNEDDSQRARHYEDGNRTAAETVGKLESGLNSVEEQMQGLGKQITDGITDVGELGSVSDRIAGASSDIAGHACRIEEGIQRIEQILYEAEKNSSVLADDGGCTGGGSGS